MEEVMSIYIRFEYGQEDRQSKDFGPYEFIQQTYEAMRVEPVGGDGNADEQLAYVSGDLWLVDGVTYSDFIIWGDKS
jgi:hypothetical protein